MNTNSVGGVTFDQTMWRGTGQSSGSVMVLTGNQLKKVEQVRLVVVSVKVGTYLSVNLRVPGKRDKGM